LRNLATDLVAPNCQAHRLHTVIAALQTSDSQNYTLLYQRFEKSLSSHFLTSGHRKIEGSLFKETSCRRGLKINLPAQPARFLEPTQPAAERLSSCNEQGRDSQDDGSTQRQASGLYCRT